MKNKFLGAITYILSITAVYSQMEPETLYLKSNFSFISDNPEFVNDTYVDDESYISGGLFQFSASVGMFFHDNFLVGLTIPLNYEVNGDASFIGADAFLISIFSKYYFNISSSKKWKLTLEGQAGYGKYSYEDSVVYSYKYGAGVSYFLNKKMSIDFSLLYGYESMEPDSDDYYLTGYRVLNKGLEPSLGLSLYL